MAALHLDNEVTKRYYCGFFRGFVFSSDVANARPGLGGSRSVRRGEPV